MFQKWYLQIDLDIYRISFGKEKNLKLVTKQGWFEKDFTNVE